ncbi:MAG TPA: hypothetical protein VIK86_07835 [Candidatus Paceibacterota bacterium]
MAENYDGKYLKIRKRLFDVGFDEFNQAGIPSLFDPMNIVAISKALNKKYWISVTSGYRCPESFSISFRELNNIKAEGTRIICKNQDGIIEQLNKIRDDIQLVQ